MSSTPPTSAFLSGGYTYWVLNPVYGGSYPGGGESYFFGVVSDYPPTLRTVWVHTLASDVGRRRVPLLRARVPARTSMRLSLGRIDVERGRLARARSPFERDQGY